VQRIKLTEKNYKEVIKQATAVLKRGGLVVYPTETCYGIAAGAKNQAAVNKLLQYKTKRKDKPLSVAVSGKQMAAQYVHINRAAENIYDNFLPGPITVVSKGKGKLAQGIESSMGTQGIRMSSHAFVLALVRSYKTPITATSANASYKKTPYTIKDVLDNISDKQKSLLDLIIDAGKLPKRKPSTVVDTTLDNLHIVREGSIKLHKPTTYKAKSLADTEKFVGKLYDKLKASWGKRQIVFLLQGDLGAGKTHLAKFIGKKLGVKEVIVSPTYNLCNEYGACVGRKKLVLYHIDTYRMYEPAELEDLRPQEIFRSPNVVVIEWANKVHSYVQKYLNKAAVVEIVISAPSDFERVFEFKIRNP
jgi:L-threonylcarbamoyladenylate synthase